MAGTGRTYVIGAGLAGLSAALRLSARGHAVTLIEADESAGGRCRSYYDERLETWIDSGNHVVLSGSRETRRYLTEIGARRALSKPHGAVYPFVDLASGERWSVRPNALFPPFWILSRGRRPPGAGIASLFGVAALALAGPEAKVGGKLRKGTTAWRNLWEPLSAGLLSTEADQGSARMLGRMLWRALWRGGGRLRPMVPTAGLSAAFIDPALETLEGRGAEIILGKLVRRLRFTDDAVTTVEFADHRIDLELGDSVVLATPPDVAARLVPQLGAPVETRVILTAYMQLPHRARLKEGIPFLGMVGGHARWLSIEGKMATVSAVAARDLAERPVAEIARLMWRDTAAALGLDPKRQPPMRVARDRRAAIACTPEALARRPGSATQWPNLVLAGDWTDTGLPPCIEGAIRSGRTAGDLLMSR